MFVIANIMS